MIDYSEGYLKMKRQLADLWEALNAGRHDDAKELCIRLSVEARMIYQHLSMKEKDDGRSQT